MSHRLAAASTPAPAGAVSWAEMAGHRSYLVRFARQRLMDPALAEDLVHDVFEAVASGRAAFGGRAALRSWLVGILKHKIVDLVRQRVGHDSLCDGEEDDSAATPLACPRPGPDELAEQRQRLQRTLQGIGQLPEGLRRVVELRVLQDHSTEDVCRALAISEDNLFVRLHRARRVLAAQSSSTLCPAAG
ncbi:MAG TPA: sigma-70 family RNA polymerase sigma factor [Rubrivivax sp.]|nr:sigma-70 family RNA polymerase sigma factor [Rubrivivax sp.]